MKCICLEGLRIRTLLPPLQVQSVNFTVLGFCRLLLSTWPRLYVFLFLGFYFLLKEVEVLFFKVRVQLNRLANGDNLKQKAPHSAKSRVVKEILFSYLLILIIKEIPFSYLLILIMIHLTPHLIHTHTHTVIEVHSALGFACKQIVLARIDLKLCIGL